MDQLEQIDKLFKAFTLTTLNHAKHLFVIQADFAFALEAEDADSVPKEFTDIKIVVARSANIGVIMSGVYLMRADYAKGGKNHNAIIATETDQIVQMYGIKKVEIIKPGLDFAELFPQLAHLINPASETIVKTDKFPPNPGLQNMASALPLDKSNTEDFEQQRKELLHVVHEIKLERAKEDPNGIAIKSFMHSGHRIIKQLSEKDIVFDRSMIEASDYLNEVDLSLQDKTTKTQDPGAAKKNQEEKFPKHPSLNEITAEADHLSPVKYDKFTDLVQKGIAFFKQKNYKKAKPLFQSAKDIDPKNAGVMDYLKEIKNLEKE